MPKILIKNGRVWDGEKFYVADVLTDGAKIIKIENKIDEIADFSYDATDKIVSAGLVDIHVHFLGYFGINAELACIPFGVTAAAEVFAAPQSKEKYDNYLVKNKLFVSAEFKNNQVNYENIEKMLEYYKDRAIGIKVYFDTTISDIKDIEPLKEICTYAKSHHLIVMVHCPNSPATMSEIISVLNKGDILTHTYHGGVNTAADDDYKCLKLAKEKGIILDAGFAANFHTDFGIFEEAIQNGCLPETISTDITRFSAYKRGGRYGMTMCMGLAKKLGMTEEDIFRSVTSAPARALGKEEEWGFLKVGRCADIAVFDYGYEPFSLTDCRGNTIESKESYRCVLTVANGEVVYRI